MNDLPIDVYWVARKATGWQNIGDLARLAADLFGGRLIETEFQPGSRMQRARLALAPAGRRENKAALLIANDPSDMYRLLAGNVKVPRYDVFAIYIIDSFHTDVIPGRSFANRFDLIIQATAHDLDYYNARFGDRARHLPIGADVWGRGGYEGERDIDLLRIGRQPPVWDDDDAAAAAAARAGVAFHGRPPYGASIKEQNRILDQAQRRAKFVLASSNLVSPHAGTHPTKEYFTMRWTAALGQGATVFGVQPKSDTAMRDLLWPEATEHIDTLDLEANLATVAKLAGDWTPEQARKNYLMSLARLDWRWRLRKIADWLGLSAPRLDADLAAMQARLAAEHAAAPHGG